MYLTNIADLNYEIMLRLDYQATLQYCMVNQTIVKICNPKFWHEKIQYDDQFIDIKDTVIRWIARLKDSREIMLIENMPSIELILPKRILLDIPKRENDNIQRITTKLISIYFNHEWYIRYSETNNDDYNLLVEYPLTVDEVNYILMNVFYYIYNNVDIDIAITD